MSEPEPKLFESRSRSGIKKFRLHNTGCSKIPSRTHHGHWFIESVGCQEGLTWCWRAVWRTSTLSSASWRQTSTSCWRPSASATTTSVTSSTRWRPLLDPDYHPFIEIILLPSPWIGAGILAFFFLFHIPHARVIRDSLFYQVSCIPLLNTAKWRY